MNTTRQRTKAVAQLRETPPPVFGRGKETEEVKRRLSSRKSFVLHGASGAGKTFLIRHVIQALPHVLYCSNSSTPQLVFQSLARALVAVRDRSVRSWLRNSDAINGKSTISLRGIVLEAVRQGNYWIVLDHLHGPAAALSSDTRDLMFYGDTPVVAVARSEHMEDLGFLMGMFSLRAERMRMPNFARREALLFAEELARRLRLDAVNLSEFLEKVVEFSHGSPGAIQRMIQMATLPRYRSEGYVKTSPLYIDFRLAWHAENAA